MSSTHFVKAGIMALALVITFFICWESYLRLSGYKISYNDDDTLWADKRAQVYEPQETSTVIIGSSRVKFDIDIARWEEMTGENAVQLSIQGSNPIPLLKDLADDPRFKGKLIIGVTEGLFFATREMSKSLPEKRIKYYKKETPTQKFSFIVNRGLESGFVFLEENSFALNAPLDRLKIPNRPGVIGPPPFPIEFKDTNFERQSMMSEKFLNDTSLQNRVKGIWAMFGNLNRKPGVAGDTLQNIFEEVKLATHKIKARGGKVMFVRAPSSGPFRESEKHTYPRDRYWNKILSSSDCEGIHFEDYPETSNFTCPEWSHLTPQDATIYTERLIEILAKKGWLKANASTSSNSLSQR